MGKWDFYKERNIFNRSNTTMYHKKKDDTHNHDETDFEELERLREDRRHKGSKLLGIVNFILLVGILAIILLLLDLAGDLIK